MWREEIYDHVAATFLSYSCVSSLSLVCASSIETVDQYVCKREPRGKKKQTQNTHIIIMLRFLLKNYLKVD